MKVSLVTIDNVLGIEHLEFRPGIVTVISGANGTGKTSTLEAVRSAVRGGHDGSLLRAGAEKGSVRLVLEDGTEIMKTIGKDASPLKVSLPGAGRVSKGQALVDSLVDSLGVDPMALINCPAQKRAEYLADVMALDVPETAIREAAGRPVAVGKLPAGASGLDRLEAVRKALFDERTGQNRTARDKKAMATQLRETLPPETNAADDLGELRAKRAELHKNRAEAVFAADGEAARCEKAASRTKTDAVEAIKANAQAELDAIRADAAERIRTIERERDSALERVKERAREEADARAEEEKAACHRIAAGRLVAFDAAESAFGVPAKALSEEIARAEERAKEHARAEKTREILAAAERDAEKAETDAKSLTEALERIDALKGSLLEKLPIKGLEIREGGVFVDGLPFERINSARQIEVAFQVAKLRAGKVGLIVADGLERFDEETYRTFEAAAASAGLQFVVGRVGSGELAVRTLPAAEEGVAA
ncbi:MAG: AAA family ATPase [Elusimicrobiota bacterium]|jgi:hypothetical protein